MNAKQHYTIVFTNDLSYEDYEAYPSGLFYGTKQRAEQYLERNGYNWDDEYKEYKNYEAKQWQRVARVIKIEELYYYFG